MASGSDTIWAVTTPATTNAAAVTSDPSHGGRGMTSRAVRICVARPRSRLCGSTSSTTNSRAAGMANRNWASSTLSVGK
jgi:hypothetical protein